MVTVAIPVLDGRRWLPDVLAAIRAQRLDEEVELLVCDSGSRDGSPAIARDAGARVIELGAEGFDHARTRNLLVSEARGEFVALLSQDAQPASDTWLATLLAGFAVADDVALVYGPYIPRPDCPPLEASRLRLFFASLAAGDAPRVDRLSVEERADGAATALATGTLGPARGYFSDANGCIRRTAWEAVRYPDAPYAEDHALAVAMLRAGWSKVLMPGAGALHSHHYPPLMRLRRAFDDYRGLREVYGYREPVSAGHLVSQLRGAAGVGLRGARADGASPAEVVARTGGAVGEQVLQLAGAILGSRADRLPPVLRAAMSLSGRPGFAPIDWRAAPVDREAQRCT